MRTETIARNYAETLLELARRAGDAEGWGKMIDDVANAMREDATLRGFLSTPRLSAAAKNEILASAFQDRMPRLLVRFLQTVVSNRRQAIIPEIAEEYRALLDVTENRVHAQVTVAREASAADRKMIAEELSRVLGKKVIPHLIVNPAILGGVVVRVGDDVMDGSVRRKLASLRNQLVHSGEPPG
jgi:F-type H+-transporting ATPase subunit delta